LQHACDKWFGAGLFARKECIMVKKLVLILFGISLASPILLSGCNTVAGMGSDVASAGQKLHDEAREHQRY
jgi:predicted small secreted protein